MELLRVGSKGNSVVEVQQLLNKRLKPTQQLVADGVFGPKTEAAVKAFQAKYGLTVDGIVGPRTMAALKNDSLPVPRPGHRVSWLNWGQKVSARSGAITVIYNPAARNSSLSSSGNRVGFLIEETPSHYKLLGGNQSNTVKVSAFSKKSYQLKAYRWPW